ncbi:hypothetical protein MMC25_000623 [Agyrium rufum]|nr:hypothetical protein [Agyrium rufum]
MHPPRTQMACASISRNGLRCLNQSSQQHVSSQRVRLWRKESATKIAPQAQWRGLASSTPPGNAFEISDLAESSHVVPLPSKDVLKSFDPVAQSRARTKQLPPSRYRFRPPKYYRGPLHPHQPPPPSDPASREFIPGPFSLPRLQQTYTSTVRQDLLTLLYQHVPPGQPLQPSIGPRLRQWDESSPYHKNRPLRPPMGGTALPLAKRRTTFNNVPVIERVTVSAMIRDAQQNSAYLHVAGMILQAMTGVRAEVRHARRSMPAGRNMFQQVKGKPIGLVCKMEGELMWDFVGKLSELVLPGVKDYKGVSGKSGDGSGNLGFGVSQEGVGQWPEIAVNYDS